MNFDDSEFLGVDLVNIKRVLVRPGEMGFDIDLHHYYMLSDAEAKVFNKNKPMAIININPDKTLSVVGFCCRKWYDNIETITEPPGDKYELIIFSFFEAGYSDNMEDYTQ